MLAAVASAFEAPDDNITGLASDGSAERLYAVDATSRMVYCMNFSGVVVGTTWELSLIPDSAEIRGMTRSGLYLAILYYDGAQCWVRLYDKDNGAPFASEPYAAVGSSCWGLGNPPVGSLAYNEFSGDQWSINRLFHPTYLGPINVPFTEHYDIACISVDIDGDCVFVACPGDTLVRGYSVSTGEHLPERAIVASSEISSADGLAPSTSQDALWVSSISDNQIYIVSIEPNPEALRACTWAGIKNQF